MADRIISDLLGTLKTSFRVSTLKAVVDTGILKIKTTANAMAPVGASAVDVHGGSYKTRLSPAASGQGADLDFKLPAADGSSGQAIVTDASGNLSFATVATGSNAVKTQSETVAFGTSSPVTMFTPPANATIQSVLVDVETAFDGTAPSLSVGVSGETSRYMGTTDLDLKTVAIYEVTPSYEEDGTPEAVIITYSADSSSEGSAIVYVTYSNPS